MFIFLVRAMRSGHRTRIALLLTAAAGCVLLGAVLFAHAQRPHIPFTSGLYWAVTTATTVGYGDVNPDTAISRVIASGVMLTTIPLLASVFALATGGYVTARIRRMLAMHSPFPDRPYRVVIGTNQTVPAILDQLVAAGVSVVLVADVDPDGLPAEVHHVRADATQDAAIMRARPEGAEQALITGASDGDVLVSSVLTRRLAPQLPIIALVSSPSVREALADLGVQQTVSAHDLIAATLAKSLEAPHAGDMVAQLVESRSHRLAEVPATGLAGKPLSAVRDERAGLVLGLVHDGKFTLGLADDPLIETGDYLLIAERARPDAVRARRATAGPR